MKIGVLSFQTEPAYTQLSRAAQSLGHEVEELVFPYDMSEHEAAWKAAERLIQTADALILPSPIIFVGGKPEWQAQIHQRVADGLRIMVNAWRNDLELQNRFLSFYGLAASEIRLHTNAAFVRVHKSPQTYRGANIFSGIDSVDIYEASLVVARLEAVPVLLAPGDELPVDGRSDRVVGWVGGDRPLIAMWSGERGGGVLLVGGSIIGDPWKNQMLGSEYAGIASNQQLASNIISFLLSRPPQPDHEQEQANVVAH